MTFVCNDRDIQGKYLNISINRNKEIAAPYCSRALVLERICYCLKQVRSLRFIHLFRELCSNMRNTTTVKFAMTCIAFLLTHMSVTPSALAQTSTAKKTNMLGNEDTTFIFAGLCPNGQTYRLLSYQKETEGKVYALYDYEGPVGTGTVKTRATPKTMAVRVCRAMAEILDDAS